MSMAVPPLKALKHLILCHDSYGDAACSAISELQQLQTLKLIGRSGATNLIGCAPLQLTGLSQLKDVAIHHMFVREGKIHLPPGCTLHIREELEIRRLYWETSARNGQLETLHFVDWTEREQLPPFVCWAGCTHLFWDTCNVGKLAMPVEFSGPSLHHLKELYMGGDVISIRLPVDLRLEVLHITADELMIACIDAHAFAQGLRQLSFVYRLLTGHGVPEIAVQMGKLGKKMIPIPADYFPEEVIDNEYEEQKVPWSGMYCHTFYTLEECWPCKCCACEVCLSNGH